MNIEIHKPELERRVLEGIQSGRFQDVDELLTKALDALSEKEAARPHSGADLIAAIPVRDAVL
jgi:Arc/MetJ-type ribon-helix-helix transcriptional regulator